MKKESFNNIKSSGGTSFDVIFENLNKLEKLPIAIIIITDGYADFPLKERSKGIPVFWAINTNVVPTFGYRIKI